MINTRKEFNFFKYFNNIVELLEKINTESTTLILLPRMFQIYIISSYYIRF